MAAILALLTQYLPLVLGAVQTVETVSNTLATKPTGQQKLSAAVGMITTAAPEIAATVAASPDHSNHLNDYVSGVVGILNALNGWSAAQTATAQAQQAASGA